jgi:hypothetical protein
MRSDAGTPVEYVVEMDIGDRCDGLGVRPDRGLSDILPEVDPLVESALLQ